MNAESRLIAQLKSHVMRCREYRHRQHGKTTSWERPKESPLERLLPGAPLQVLSIWEQQKMIGEDIRSFTRGVAWKWLLQT